MSVPVRTTHLVLLAVMLFLLTGAASCVPAPDFDEKKPITQAVLEGIRTGKATFSHSEYDALLKKHVKASGRVDYAALKQEHGELEAYLDRLAEANLAKLSRENLHALLINAYNAYTLDLIVRNYPTDSIKSLKKPWDTAFCRLGGETITLNDIEHKLLRPKELFFDPRMHFAINCASIGCPQLRAEAYTGERVDDQLEQAVRSAANDPRYVAVEGKQVRVSRILDWFKGDFVEKYGSVSRFLLPYVGEEARVLLEQGDEVLVYFDYDWGLNDVERE